MTDIALFGTGAFASRILFDLAATAAEPLSIAVVGRNDTAMRWMRSAAQARARMFGRDITVSLETANLTSPEEIGRLLDTLTPSVVVQSASVQTASIIGTNATAWSELVGRTSLSLTAPFQALITGHVARAIAERGGKTKLVNCCYPDVVNPLIAGMGLDVLSGLGNVAILSEMFGGMLGRDSGQLRILAPYQAVGPWRRLPSERTGDPAARIWIGETEVDDIFARFREAQLTAVPVIDISGASGVTLIEAVATGRPWTGHVPGPNGLPGGYPVHFDGSAMALDLPTGIDQAAAVDFCLGFERESGMIVDADGIAHYTGSLHDALEAEGCELHRGFALTDLDEAVGVLAALRDRLNLQSAA
ncbi:hypothetical protein [Alloyangia pacifica]|uniref:Saccharopine dehydrogenase NADP binding domain-containing protein n=1 Tax=Alloyangia pacifica TaxID=311180 RepID=A0A1I6V0W4_9RHOB|nr:hypothetical protein [Alloyangia pacifica]SDI33651.1 hypothetical protein SAMN04488245_114144 [Alloyangia pacifica]SFT07294.1 hypothetical protein SAMN04488050_109193 [Alloyangia pacifica]